MPDGMDPLALLRQIQGQGQSGARGRRRRRSHRMLGGGSAVLPLISAIGGLGDSKMNQNGAAVAGAVVRALGPRGPIVHALARPALQRRIYFDPTWNLGVSGDTTTQTLARLPAAMALPVDTIAFNPGTNDGLSPLDGPGGTWTNSLLEYETAIANRKRALILPVTPRTQARWDLEISQGSTAQIVLDTKNKVETLRARQIAYAASKPAGSVLFADIYTAMLDSTGDRVAKPEYYQPAPDGLHESILGAEIQGAVIEAVLTPWAGPRAVDFAEVDAILSNPKLTGTGGTIQAGIVASVAPTGYIIQRSRVNPAGANDSGTITVSQVASTDGVAEPWWRIVFDNVVRTASDGNDTFSFGPTSIPLSAGKWAPGDTLEYAQEMRLISHAGGLTGLSCNIEETDGTTTHVMWANQGATAVQWPVPNSQVWLPATRLLSARPASGAGTPGIQFRPAVAQYDPRVNATFTFDVRRQRVRKIA